MKAVIHGASCHFAQNHTLCHTRMQLLQNLVEEWDMEGRWGTYTAGHTALAIFSVICAASTKRSGDNKGVSVAGLVSCSRGPLW